MFDYDGGSEGEPKYLFYKSLISANKTLVIDLNIKILSLLWLKLKDYRSLLESQVKCGVPLVFYSSTNYYSDGSLTFLPEGLFFSTKIGIICSARLQNSTWIPHIYQQMIEYSFFILIIVRFSCRKKPLCSNFMLAIMQLLNMNTVWTFHHMVLYSFIVSI